MTQRLGDLTWPVLPQGDRSPMLVVPVGSCEQHGPHLPLDTDTRVAVALADALVAGLPAGAAVVAPPVTVTSSGEHRGFPGTLSIGAATTELVVVELCRSADWASGVLLVNGHGGNRVPVSSAVATLEREGRRVVSWWPMVEGGDAHAGRTETSLMLAIDPSSVAMDLAAPGSVAPLSAVLDRLRTDGVAAVAPNGVLGDPRGASADEGRMLFDQLLDDLRATVRRWRE